MIKNIRVDYRLLHGQVALAWTQYLGADALLLVSDTVKDDPLRMQTLRLAKPEATKVVIKNAEEAVQILKSGVTNKYKLFIICETIDIAAKIASALGVNAINIGNVAYASDRKQVSKSVFLDEHDTQSLRKLVDQGFTLYIQMVPTESKTDVRKVLKEV